MVNWPESLIIELASRRCIIFLGAGASAGATRSPDGEHPPSWHVFLEKLLAGSNRGTQEYLSIAKELHIQKRYLECAEILRSTCLHPADYNRLIGSIFERYKPTVVQKAVETIDQ